MNAAKTYELLFTDHRGIVTFFRNRIKCNCLDEEYEKVKDLPKTGVCANVDCKLPNRRAEKSQLLTCGTCRQVNYCSRKCQKIGWQSHKRTCGKAEGLIQKHIEEMREHFGPDFGGNSLYYPIPISF